MFVEYNLLWIKLSGRRIISLKLQKQERYQNFTSIMNGWLGGFIHSRDGEVKSLLIYNMKISW